MGEEEEGSEGTADSMPPLETVDDTAANDADPNSQSDEGGVRSESQKNAEEIPDEVPQVPKVPEDVPEEDGGEEHLATDDMEAAEDGNDEEMQEDENVGVNREGDDGDSDQGDQVDHEESDQGDQQQGAVAQDREGPGAQEVGEQDAASD